MPEPQTEADPLEVYLRGRTDIHVATKSSIWAAHRQAVKAARDAALAEAADRLEAALAGIYGQYDNRPAYVAVAAYCDEVLDRSGALLGRVRARAALRSGGAG